MVNHPSSYDTFQVIEPAARLDKYLAILHPELSRSRIQKLIEQKYILVNDGRVKSSQSLNVGDIVNINLPPPELIKNRIVRIFDPNFTYAI